MRSVTPTGTGVAYCKGVKTVTESNVNFFYTFGIISLSGGFIPKHTPALLAEWIFQLARNKSSSV